MSNYAQEYTRLPQPDVSPTSLSVRDAATGRRINAAPYYSEHWSTLRTYVASMSYVTGSHAMKVGMNLSEGPRHEKATVNGDMTLNFNGPNPVSVILTASPRDARERLNADLGIYAQDQWTIDRMTLNLGLRFDYLNAKLEAQNFPAGTFVPARSLGELPGLPSWKDLNPRLGLAYDLFGNGKTALKASFGRYQRPDADLGYDSTRTSLNGDFEQVSFAKVSGNLFRFETSYQRTSPGFEINDLGFLNRADKQNQSTWANFSFNKPAAFYRRLFWNLNQWNDWTVDGLPLDRAFNTNVHTRFNNRIATPIFMNDALDAIQPVRR